MPESRRHIPVGREKLARVMQAAGDIIQITDASATLSLSRAEAAKLLSRWTVQGWLRRIGPGAYAPVPIESLQSAQVLPDPWVMVPALFEPAYIGGRTAAEHWDLTEQVFRDVVVFTAQHIRKKSVEFHGALFTLRHCPLELQFGTKIIWRGKTRIALSDVHRTIIDMLAEPPVGGGIQHVEDCFRAYLKRSDRNANMLVAFAERLGNGAVFKRLGFLAERAGGVPELVTACKQRLTKGNARLDPSIKSARLITRWRLFVPETWAKARHD